jgi:hypothetical protein
MDIHWYTLPVTIVIMMILLHFTGIGLFGMIKRRPIVISSRFDIWLALLVFGFSLLSVAVGLFDIVGDFIFPEDPEVISNTSSRISAGFFVFILCMMIVLILFLVYHIWRRNIWNKTEEFEVWGVTADSFRDALVVVLNKLNLPFHETISRIRLPSLQADLLVSVGESSAIARIRIKQLQHGQRIKEIAAALNEYYRETPVKVNSNAFVFALVFVILMVIFWVYPTFIR